MSSPVDFAIGRFRTRDSRASGSCSWVLHSSRSTPPSSSISNLLVQAGRPDSSSASNSPSSPALPRDAKVPTLTMLRWTSPFQDPGHGCLPPGPPGLAVLPGGRSGTPSPRFVCFSQVGSQLRQRFALVCSCSSSWENARQRAQLGALAWELPPPLGRAAIAPTIYGSETQFRHEYARLAAYRKEENSSPTPHKQPLGSSYRPEYRATSLACLGSQEIPPKCCLRRIILEAR